MSSPCRRTDSKSLAAAFRPIARWVASILAASWATVVMSASSIGGDEGIVEAGADTRP